jgi:hypothetical protein
MTDFFIRRAVSVGTLGASLLLFGCGGGGDNVTQNSNSNSNSNMDNKTVDPVTPSQSSTGLGQTHLN